MKETSLWRWLDAGQKPMPRTWLRRIENAVGSGDPDVDGIVDGNAFKVELKIGKLLTSGVVQVEFRPLQVPFLTNWWKAGGASFLLVRVEHNLRYPPRFLIRGIEVETLFTNVRGDVWEARIVDLTEANLIEADADAETVIRTMAGQWK